MSFLSTKLLNIKPSPTLAVVKKAAELKAKGIDVISLGAGEPDFDTPDHIKKFAIEAINKGFTKYTAVDGIVELKQAVIDKLKSENGLDYNINQVTIANGGKQIIFNAFMASLNPGDEVIIPAPFWVSYPEIVSLMDGVPVFVDCHASNDFKLKPSDLESKITNKTKWLVINSPNNPSGAVYSAKELKEIAEILLKYEHVNIMSDDIYEHIIYDNFEFATIASIEPRLKDRVLVINGVSKSYSMTGWRIGYGAGNQELIKAMNVIQSQSTSNSSSISQKAAFAALTGEQEFLKHNAEIFQQRRDMMVDLLNNIKGISCNKPQGAFYLLPSCEGLIGLTTQDKKILKNSDDVANYFLEQANVAVVSGSAFGAEGHFRVSYATANKILEEACKRISEAVNKLC